MAIEHWSNPVKITESGKSIGKTSAEHDIAVQYAQHTGKNIDLRGNQTALPKTKGQPIPEAITGHPSTWVDGNPTGMNNEGNVQRAATVLGNLRRLTAPNVSPDKISQWDGHYGFIHPETGETVGYLGGIATSPQLLSGGDWSQGGMMYTKTSNHPIYRATQQFFGGETSPLAKDSDGRVYATVMHRNGDGRTVPLRFWCSSGNGGKKGTPVGEWYYSPGVTDDDGWLGKWSSTSDPNMRHAEHYNIPILKFYSEQLGKLVGNVSATTDISEGNQGQVKRNFNPLAAAFIPPIRTLSTPQSRFSPTTPRAAGSEPHLPLPSYAHMLEPQVNAFTDPAVASYASNYDFHGKKSTGLMGVISDYKVRNEIGDDSEAPQYALLKRHFDYLRNNLSFRAQKSLLVFRKARRRAALANLARMGTAIGGAIVNGPDPSTPYTVEQIAQRIKNTEQPDLARVKADAMNFFGQAIPTLKNSLVFRTGLKKSYKTPAWQRAEGQNPKGGLNAKGRASAKAEGHNLKPPVKSGNNPRRAAFLARMGNSPGPEYDEHGKPTRLLLALQAWGASSKADARKKAKAISARLHANK